MVSTISIVMTSIDAATIPAAAALSKPSELSATVDALGLDLTEVVDGSTPATVRSSRWRRRRLAAAAAISSVKFAVTTWLSFELCGGTATGWYSAGLLSMLNGAMSGRKAAKK